MPALNRTTFFAYCRRAPFGGRLTTGQVDGLNRILDEWQRRGLTDLRWLAYMLATVFHETAATMQPVRERGGEEYLKRKRYYPWVGEGLVQVTWKENHAKFGATRPGQLLEWPIALKALFDGMLNGMFTGRRLSDYFNSAGEDAKGARRIVNGRDKDQLIAGYYAQFMGALQAADVTTPQPADVKPEAAKPDDVPAAQSKSLWAIATSFLTGTFSLSFLGSINNPWALLAFGLLIAAGGVGAWLVLSGRITINRSKAVAP